MKKIVIFMSIHFLVTACEKREDRILVSDLVSKTQYYDSDIFNKENQGIYGKWEFLYTYGGIGGSKYDAEYDYLEVIKFGIYGKVVDSEIREYGQIRISKQDENETKINFLSVEKYRTDCQLIEQVLRFKGPDTLILSGGFFDGYENYYKRLK